MHAAAVILLLVPLMVVLPGARVAQAGTPTGGPPLAFVVDHASGGLEVLNAQTNQPIQATPTITSAELGGPANAVAVTPDGRFALVTVGPPPQPPMAFQSQASPGPGFTGVVAVDTVSLQVVDTVTTTSTGSAIAIAPDGKTAYVEQTYPFPPEVTAINIAESPPSATPSITLSAQATVNAGFQSMSDEAVSPDGQSLYVLGLARVTPALANAASPPTTIGGTISDMATLSGGYFPSGTITFSVFGPNDPTCSGPAVTSTVFASENGAYSSGEVTPTAVGTYSFVTAYLGDNYNNPVTTPCGAPGSTTTVTPAMPTLSTTATPAVLAGGAIFDSARLSGGYNPTGTITFQVYGPNDPGCNAAPVFTTADPVNRGNGTYRSNGFTPTARGTYSFVATYSGGASNLIASSPCGAPGETTTVGFATPSVSTTASPPTILDYGVTDTATLSGGFSPTGTLTFQLYGPNDPACSSPSPLTTTDTVQGNGTYVSAPVYPTASGAYGFVVTYSGDASNQAATSPCGAAGESTTAADFTPSISTTASAPIVIGGTISDNATIGGAVGYGTFGQPTGTMTFQAFTNSACTGAAAFTTTATVYGNGTYSSGQLSPAEAGAYDFVASYSGDAISAPVTEPCGAGGETTSVLRAAPVLTGTAAVSAAGTVYDTVTLTAGFQPGGTISFSAYGPNDPACSSAPEFTSTATVTGNGTYTSAQFTPVAGNLSDTYDFVASYSGDTNNQAVETTCGNPAQTVTTIPAQVAPVPTLEALPLPLGSGPGAALAVPSGSTQMVVAPDGSAAYLTVPDQSINSGTYQPSFVEKIGLTPTLTDEGPIPAPVAPGQCSGPNSNVCPSPVAEAIATTPQGSASLWVAETVSGVTGTVYEVPLPVTPPFTPTVTVSVAMYPYSPPSLAATPDGSALEVSMVSPSSFQGEVVAINLGTDAVNPCVATAASACPAPGGGDIAITPDQRPVAAFTAAPGLAGQPSSFDASASTVAYNQIASYAWDFGDGATATVTGTVVTHIYALTGTYTVSLTETSEAGATVGTLPPSTVFTGKTMTRRGGPPASTSQQVTIPALPPSPSPSPSPSSSPSPTVTATLTLDPTVGTPGTVVAATGVGFPANATVTLTWTVGIGAPVTVQTDATGGFVQRILILPNDDVGYRFLTTSNPVLKAQFLVEPLSLDPAGKDPLLFRH